MRHASRVMSRRFPDSLSPRATRHTTLLLLLTVCGSLLTSSCGVIRRMAASRMVEQLETLAAVVERQTDLELLKEAAPASLILMEALVDQNPDRRDLLVLTCRSYTGYAQAFLDRTDPSRASALYLKARDFGLRALRLNRRFETALEGGEDFDRAVRLLDDSDLEAMFWTLSAWAAYVNLHLYEVESLFDLPDLRALLFRVNEIDPDYYFGSPRIFLGVFYSTLPSIAGGGAEQARSAFEDALRSTGGRFLLVRVMRARYYATLIGDEQLFEQDLEIVMETPSESFPEAGLLNEVAKRMAEDFLKRKDELF